MTPEFERFVESSTAAERAGDAAAALEFHSGVPMFARGAHKVQLTQLAGVMEEMTSWMWTRWAAYQCTRVEDPGTRCREQTRAALDYVLRMFYSDRVEEAYLAGGDLMQVLAQLAGEGWLYHQLCTFEFGGLETFVDTLATGQLSEGATLAHAWADARMGGFRLESMTPGGLTVHDLRAGRSVAVLDLGAAVHVGAEGWLLGRLVPSGTTPELMFDSRPIPVDEQTARDAAAGALPGSWVTAVKDAITEGRVDRALFESEDRELLTDVPSLALVRIGTPTAALDATLSNLAAGRDEVGRAAYRILKRVSEDSFGPDVLAPYVAAAVLNVHGYDEARRHLTGSGGPNTWAHWADLVPDPARGRLRELAGLAEAA